MYYDYEVKDYGFEEDDIQFLFITADEKEVKLEKIRSWFLNPEIDEMDYNINWAILVDNKKYITFPKDVDRDVVVSFAHSQFEADLEATSDIQAMYAEMEAERRFGA